MEVKKFRKKPIVIEAIQWTGNNWEEIGKFVGQAASLAKENGKNILLINTLESGKNKFQASIGDWIIKGIKGEFYACKPDIFEVTYELATEVSNGGQLLFNDLARRLINRILEFNPKEHDIELNLAGIISAAQELGRIKAIGVEEISATIQLRYFKLMHPNVTEKDAKIVADVLARSIKKLYE